jgi:hypothetical protein
LHWILREPRRVSELIEKASLTDEEAEGLGTKCLKSLPELEQSHHRNSDLHSLISLLSTGHLVSWTLFLDKRSRQEQREVKTLKKPLRTLTLETEL